jgi:XTP/dITP diphosphohydrolase
MKLLIGTNNKHKAREIQQILDKRNPGEVKLLTPAEVLGKVIDVEETGATLEENAFLKASKYFEMTKIPCFADDTGLEIDALSGLPGVQSARFSGVHGNDAANRKKVLDLLEDVPSEKRTARFRTVISFADGKNVKYFEGRCEGKIINEERGQNGFGYDSIFVPDEYKQTFAEMNPEKKNELSHRSKAVLNFLNYLIENELKESI